MEEPGATAVNSGLVPRDAATGDNPTGDTQQQQGGEDDAQMAGKQGNGSDAGRNPTAFLAGVEKSSLQEHFQQDFATLCVGAEELRVDLNACAPMAAVFTNIRNKRRKRAANATAESQTASFARAESGEGMPAGADGEPLLTYGTGDGEADLQFKEFPGGMDLLKNIVRYLTVAASEEVAAAAVAGELGVPAGVLKVDPGAFHLEFTTENISKYLEAAALLQCPRLLRETVLSPAAKELSSRRVLSCLERTLQFTSDVDVGEAVEPVVVDEDDDRGAAAQGEGDEQGSADEQDAADNSTSPEQVIQAFSQVIQRLCARLDTLDFKLTAALSSGPPWASLEILRAYRVKVENVGRVNYALQSMKSTVTSFFYEEEKPTQQHKQEWKEHHFALHVFRKHVVDSTLYSSSSTVRAIAETAMMDQENEVKFSDDEEEEEEAKATGEDDVPEAISDVVTNGVLAGLAGLVMYCDPLQTPPVIASAMVRSLLLIGHRKEARALFEAVFVRSRKAQAMVVCGQIPVDFLCTVKTHRIASVVLRRLLARHESLSTRKLCNLLDAVLEDFRFERHCEDLVLHHAIAQELVVFCRVRTRCVASADESCQGSPRARTAGGSIGLYAGSPNDPDAFRLRRVGEKLFAAVFVAHHGFLPLSEESESRGEHWPAGPLGMECPWDSGDLDLPLLHHVPTNDDSLHLSRRVLLRGLVRRQRAGLESDVPTVARLWTLGRWTCCRDGPLISEAFAFLTTCWRTLYSAKASSGWEGMARRSAEQLADEVSLFKMFSDLELWRLSPKDLLSPWVPPHVLACHLASRCRMLDEQQHVLVEDNRSNLEEINRLRQAVTQLYSKLEVVDTRSVQSMQKQAEVADTLRTLR